MLHKHFCKRGKKYPLFTDPCRRRFRTEFVARHNVARVLHNLRVLGDARNAHIAQDALAVPYRAFTHNKARIFGVFGGAADVFYFYPVRAPREVFFIRKRYEVLLVQNGNRVFFFAVRYDRYFPVNILIQRRVTRLTDFLQDVFFRLAVDKDCIAGKFFPLAKLVKRPERCEVNLAVITLRGRMRRRGKHFQKPCGRVSRRRFLRAPFHAVPRASSSARYDVYFFEFILIARRRFYF